MASLNSELANINWYEILSTSDVENGWKFFHSTLDKICSKHIPKLVLKDGFKPPWFDSEVFSMCREKDRIRKKIKKLKNMTDVSDANIPTISAKILELEVKFKDIDTRRQVRQVVRYKMCSNFLDTQSSKVRMQ